MRIKKYAAAAAAICLSVFMLASCGRYSKGDKLINKAVEYYDAADYSTALDTLMEAEASGIKNTKPEVLYYYIGETYFKLENYEKSLEYHQKAVEEKPELFKSWVTIGVCYRKLGDEGEALKSYTQALLYDPMNADSVGLYISLGSLYIANGKPYTAIDYLEKAEKLYPEHPAVHAYLAIAYAMAYEYEKSEQEMNLAIAYGYENIGEIEDRISEIEDIQNRSTVTIKQ